MALTDLKNMFVINNVLVLLPNDHLSDDGHIVVFLELERLPGHSQRGKLGDDGHCDHNLFSLVDQLLKAGHPHMGQVGDPQQEADGVQDVAFPRPVDIGRDNPFKLPFPRLTH